MQIVKWSGEIRILRPLPPSRNPHSIAGSTSAQKLRFFCWLDTAEVSWEATNRKPLMGRPPSNGAPAFRFTAQEVTHWLSHPLSPAWDLSLHRGSGVPSEPWFSTFFAQWMSVPAVRRFLPVVSADGFIDLKLSVVCMCIADYPHDIINSPSAARK